MNTLRILSIAIATALLIAVPTGCTTGAAEMQRAEKRLSAGIPDEATAAEVLVYLDQHHIEHTGYEHASIHAVIRERPSPYIFERDYTAEYRFDAHDQLVEKVVSIHYGVF